MKIFKREFKCSWLALGLYLLGLVLLCSLGFWQLSRAEQKRQYLQQQQAAIDTAVLDLNQHGSVVDSEAYRYHQVNVSGHYDNNRQFLLDNQMQDGKPGYCVLTPFYIDQQSQAVLVNRGWLPWGVSRDLLPDINVGGQARSISGRINHFPAVGIKLAGAEQPTAGWPAVVQVVDSQVLAVRLAYDVADFQIELAATASDGYLRQWKKNSVLPPEQHVAYAVQWFGLALTLSVLFFWITIKRNREHAA